MTATSIVDYIALLGQTRHPTLQLLAASLTAALRRAGSLASFERTRAPRDFAREAAAVRELAFQHRDTDPGFAADLYAAADRHELTEAMGRASPAGPLSAPIRSDTAT